MAIKGIFVSDAGALGERPESLSSSILKAKRGIGVPLFALSSGMGASDCDQTIVQWYEEGIMHSRAVVTAVPVAEGATIVVDDASWITENKVFMVESTGEFVFVLAVTGNTLTVQRGIGMTAIAPIVIGGDEIALQLIGSAFEEASERPTSIATNPYPRTNLTQIFREAWDISGTAAKSTYRFGSRVAKNKGDAGVRHAEDMERSMIWGRQHNGVVNNKPQRHMAGVISQLRSNFFVSPAGGLTRRALTDFIERVFSTNIEGMANERIAFCGNVAVRALNEIAMRYSEYNISYGETEWGINVTKFHTPFGTISLMIHPMMNENPQWSRQLYLLHPGAMEKCWFRRTFHQGEGNGTDQPNNGSASDLRDAQGGVFTSEMTVKYMMEQTGGVMTDIEVEHYVV